MIDTDASQYEMGVTLLQKQNQIYHNKWKAACF